MKQQTKIIVSRFIFFILIILLASGIIYCSKIISPAFAISKSTYIYIDEKRNYDELLLQLQSDAHIKNLHVFTQLASIMKYPENMKTGKYKIFPRMTYLQAIWMFLYGKQTSVKLIFNNIRSKKELAQRIGNQLMLDSKILLDKLNNSDVVNFFGFDTLTIMAMFIPNTYEIYWNISIDEFLKRMKKEYDRFWTKERLKKAQSISLTPIEISILASIVEEETAVKSEYPIIAGLYINRLKKKMFLQADPTVKFAVGDITLKRIFFEHLKINSLYNTYINQGLPPGPIRIPSINAIDGVLNYQNHTYLYMCAKEDLSGRHNFAATLNEHARNAQKYRAKLNQLNIQ